MAAGRNQETSESDGVFEFPAPQVNGVSDPTPLEPSGSDCEESGDTDTATPSTVTSPSIRMSV